MKKVLLIGLLTLASLTALAQSKPWSDLKIYTAQNTVILNPGEARVIEALWQTDAGEIFQGQQSYFSPKVYIH